MTHRWESLGGFCMQCHLGYAQVWHDPRLSECRPEVVVGMAARRPVPVIIIGGDPNVYPEEPA